ncbi:MAG: hypothetical protein JWN04_378 [Myxococcaceae bacterium]|nr:hypothetical protein [Myxococcaceae bacterium]
MTESALPDSEVAPGGVPPALPPPRPAGSSRPPQQVPAGKLLPLWLALASGAGLLLALTALGLLPAREPLAPKPVPFDPGKTTDPVRLPERNESTERVHRMLLWSFPLCARPRGGARMYRVALRPERDSFVIWCQGEYLLVDVDAQQELPRVTRLARFPVRGELPGGAVALDLDYDGVLDLALGVAPAAGLVHRPFSGVFWLRGRLQGGFELPRTLVEMPVVAVATAELDDTPGSELVALTRGDTAAQRAGDLWVFAGGPSPTRAAVVPTALAPSDLAVGARRNDQGEERAELWVSSTQPGSLVRLRFPRLRSEWNKPERSELALRGVQGFVSGPRGERALYVRDVQGVRSIESTLVPNLGAWLEHAEVGPAAWLHTGRESKPTLLGATEAGFAWFHGETRRDRILPVGTRVLDTSSTSAGAVQGRGVLLLETGEPGGNLALAVLPTEVRDEAIELELRSGSVEAAPTEARVALE